MMRIAAVFALALILCRPVAAEPAFGSLIGVENDFLEFQCAEQNDGLWSCDFKQISMSLKVKPEDVESEIDRRVQMFRDQTDEKEELQQMEAVCEMMVVGFAAAESVLAGDVEKARGLIETLPAESRGEFSVDLMAEEYATMSPREKDDAFKDMERFKTLCENRDETSYRDMVRAQVDKEARTCKLFINEWSDTFEKVSDNNWVIKNGGPRGACGVVRLDRFECRGSILCDFISEKRVLNKEGKMGAVPCSGLEEGEFRYKHDSDGIYLQCEIMSFF